MKKIRYTLNYFLGLGLLLAITTLLIFVLPLNFTKAEENNVHDHIGFINLT